MSIWIKEGNKMKVLISSDFYENFELIEVKKKADAFDYVVDCLEGNEPKNFTLIASSDCMSSDDAREKADLILFTSDFEVRL